MSGERIIDIGRIWQNRCWFVLIHGQLSLDVLMFQKYQHINRQTRTPKNTHTCLFYISYTFIVSYCTLTDIFFPAILMKHPRFSPEWSIQNKHWKTEPFWTPCSAHPGRTGQFRRFHGAFRWDTGGGTIDDYKFKHGKRCFWFSDTEDGLFSKSSTMGTMKIMKYPPCPQYPPWVDSFNHDISWDLGSVAVPHGGCPKIWPCNEGHRRSPKVPRSPRLEAMGVGTGPLGSSLLQGAPVSLLGWVITL